MGTMFEIHKIGNELKRLKEKENIEAVSFLLDSSFYGGCDYDPYYIRPEEVRKFNLYERSE